MTLHFSDTAYLDIRSAWAVFQRISAWAAVLIVAAALLVGPLVEGATSPVWLAALQVAAAAVGFLGVVTFGRQVRFFWLPIAVLGIGLIQTCPLPGEFVKAISPASYHAWTFASDCLGQPLAPRLSIAPAATQLAIRQLFLTTLVFAITVELVRDHRKAAFLGWVLASIGVIVLAWGCVEWVTGRDVISPASAMRWPFGYKNPLVDPLRSAAFGRTQNLQVGGVSLSLPFWVLGDGFGPYLVSNHFGGCLELTIPVVFSLLWLKQRRQATALSLAGAGTGILAGLMATTAIAVLALGASARAATVGVLLGCTWVVWQRTTGKWRRLVGLVFCLELLGYVCLFALSAWAGFSPQVAETERTANMLDLIWTSIGGAQWRVSQWGVCWRMFMGAPVTGIGLGAYRFASPFYSDSEVVTAFAHADYFEFLAEGGLLGIAVLTIFLAQIWKPESIRTFTRDSVDNPLLAGAGGALVAFLPHGFVDWNLHIPANALLFAMISGLVVGLIDPKTSGRVFSKSIVLFTKFVICVITLIFCVGAIIGAFRYAKAATSLESMRHAVLCNMSPKPATPSVDRRALLLRALPSALEAARRPLSPVDTPVLIGLAYLYLSEGKPGLELRLAEEWFEQALAGTPLRLELVATINEIRLLIATSENSRNVEQGRSAR